MDFANRRDRFLRQAGPLQRVQADGLQVHLRQPFVMHPLSEDFDNELRDFAAICRVVKKMRHLRVGAFGARTTAFKSVRYDEVAMERRGVEVESYDLTGLLARYRKMSDGDALVKAWDERLHAAMRFDGAPDYAAGTLARLGAAIQTFVDDNSLGAVALRCWTELQDELHIAPCSLLGCLNMMGVPAACETDVSNVYPWRRCTRPRRALWPAATSTTTTAPTQQAHPLPLRARAVGYDDRPRQHRGAQDVRQDLGRELLLGPERRPHQTRHHHLCRRPHGQRPVPVLHEHRRGDHGRDRGRLLRHARRDALGKPAAQVAEHLLRRLPPPHTFTFGDWSAPSTKRWSSTSAIRASTSGRAARRQ